MNWITPQKPAEFAESKLIEAILDGHFPIHSSLPPERELAAQLGVTRPTLREALQRLARDGWVEIHHGRPTRVRNYWQEGNLAVLGVIARQAGHLPFDFVANLLSVRELLAPAYTRLAVERAPDKVASVLDRCVHVEDKAEAFSAIDWELHHTLAVASGNPVFTLILNGFCDLYHTMGCRYFQAPEARESSRRFYAAMLDAVCRADAGAAETITRQVMRDSLALWEKAVGDR